MYRTERLIAVVSILLVLLTPSVLALTVTPQSQQLANPTDDVYTYVYSVMNNDPRPHNLRIELEPNSQYLKDKITLSKEQFSLLPGAAENVQLSIRPSGLGPETHALKANIYDGPDKVGSFELLITVPGTPVQKYDVRIDAKDTTPSAAVPISVEISNYGNIIGYGQLSMEVEQGGVSVGSITYPDLIQVLPGKTVPYDLLFTESLAPGFYTARVTVTFPSGPVQAVDQFSVQLDESTQRIKPGSDLVLTFASIGNPPAMTYKLLDETKKERAAGTFFPQTGDIIIPTAQLAAGTYDLYLSSQRGEQHISVVIKEDVPYMMYMLFIVVATIIAYALYTWYPVLHRRYRVFMLERAIARRQDEVINLINRSHRLVDEYTRARQRQTSGSTGTSTQRS